MNEIKCDSLNLNEEYNKSKDENRDLKNKLLTSLKKLSEFKELDEKNSDLVCSVCFFNISLKFFFLISLLLCTDIKL